MNKYCLLIIAFFIFCREPMDKPSVVDYKGILKIPLYEECVEYFEKKSTLFSSLVLQYRCVIKEKNRNDNLLEFYKKYFLSINYRLIDNDDGENFYDSFLNKRVSKKLIKMKSPDGNIFVMIGLFRYSSVLDKKQLYIHIGPNYFEFDQIKDCKNIKDFTGDIYMEYLEYISSGEKLKALSLLMPYLICKQDKLSTELYCELIKEYIGYEEEIWVRSDYKKYCQ